MRHSFFRFILLSVFLLSLFAPIKSRAAEPIGYIRLSLSYTPLTDKTNPDSVIVDTFQDEYLCSYRIENGGDAYRPGDCLLISAILTAKEGHTFTDIKRASCRMNETIAESIEISQDGGTLSCRFCLPALMIILPSPENPSLSRNGIAAWKSVRNADNYRVDVQYINEYGGLNYLGSLTTALNSADISSFLYSAPRDYVFSVSACSDRYYLSDSEPANLPLRDSILITASDIGLPASILWSDGSAHPDDSDSIAKDTVLRIAGRDYYFNREGLRESGWKFLDGKWYYFLPDSLSMAKGPVTIDGSEYYLDPETGAMVTGFVTISGKERFFSDSGAQKTGWVRYQNKIYYVLPNGGRNYAQLIDASGRTYLFDRKDGHLLSR